MIALGFKPLGENGLKQRRFFQRKDSVPINLHIFEDSDPEVGRHLRFCNYLKNHPVLAKEYSDVKQRLAKQYPHDIYQYVLGKEKFVKRIDTLAANDASPQKPIKSRKREKWTHPEIIQAMQNNMHSQMTLFAKYIPSMEIVFEFDVTVVRSQIPDDLFNYVLSAQFTEKNARDRVKHVLSLFSKNPFSWWVNESDSLLQSVLLEQGFSYKEKDVGMYLELANYQPILTSPLSFQRVESHVHLKDFADVIVAIGGNPEAFEQIYSQLPPVIYCGETAFEMYVAYLEGAPAVTGILVTHANVAGIYYVATMPNQRKKGFGTEMMNHLLKRAKEKGYFIATLQASHAGLSLYERLGFQKCCKFIEYSPPTSRNVH